MGLLAILKLITVIFSCSITILTGFFFIKHRELIFYFKDTFGFIKDDFDPTFESQQTSFSQEVIATINNGIKSLSSNKVVVEKETDSSVEINRILILIGKILIATGLLGIIIITFGTAWMIYNSSINISLY